MGGSGDVGGSGDDSGGKGGDADKNTTGTRAVGRRVGGAIEQRVGGASGQEGGRGGRPEGGRGGPPGGWAERSARRASGEVGSTCALGRQPGAGLVAAWQSPAHMPRARTGAAQHFEFLLIAPLQYP